MRKLILIFGVCFFSFGFQLQGCQAQQQQNVRINEMSPEAPAELVVFFQEETDWKQILEFDRTVLAAPGIMTVVKVELDGYEGEAINFQPDATEDEKALLKKRVLESPLVYKIYENVIPNEITDLNPDRKTVQPSNKVSEPSPRKSKTVVIKHGSPGPQ